jgi:hypothetical protein
LCAGSLAPISAQAASRTTAAKSAVHHRTVRSDITSFSSSSAGLHVGVNHPPKK